MTSVTLAVLGLNAVLLAAGYGALTPVLAGRTPLALASYAGVALLVGAGLVGTLVFMAAIAGVRVSLPAFAICAGVVATAGLLAARRWRLPASTPAPPPSSPLEEAVAIVAGFAASAVALLGAIGASRSSPWLDDAWGIWLPKGIALTELGLDERLFAPNGTYAVFGVLDYPLWWSALTGLGVGLVGEVDVRVMNAQLALLAIAFLGAVARLLWGYVRPWLLALCVLLVAASPEFLRHMQGGLADLPLAIYLSLAALAAALWLRTGERWYLLLVFAGGATAIQVKTEALPEAAVLLAVGLITGGARRRGLALAGGAALVTGLPWLAWRAAHDVSSRVPLSDALDPGYLADRSDRVGASVEALARHLADPTEWLLIVPLLLVVAAAARKPAAIAAVGAVLAVILFAYWVDRDAIDFVLGTSAYRTVDTAVLLAGVLLPLAAEALLQQREALREDDVLVGQARDHGRVVQQD
jgi:hypothetical protein